MNNIYITNGSGEALDPLTALRNAIYHGQDVQREDGDIYPLPSPQKTGTETQRVTYATMQAEKILKRTSFQEWLNS